MNGGVHAMDFNPFTIKEQIFIIFIIIASVFVVGWLTIQW